MENIRLWQSPLFNSLTIAHGFTQRSGGVSTAPFANLNLGLHVGDDKGSVIENRRRVAQDAGFTLKSIVCAAQIHGSAVAVVDESHCGRGACEMASAIPGVDALVTDTPNVLLMLFFADCLPVFFADERNTVVAVAHAGWRGLVSGVLENTIQAMNTTFGSNPEHIIAAVGPGIGPDYFAVGPETAQHFPEEVIHRREQPYIDLAVTARIRLLSAGILPQNLTVTTDCTAANPEEYFSHRRDKGLTGRMGGFIGIRSGTNS